MWFEWLYYIFANQNISRMSSENWSDNQKTPKLYLNKINCRIGPDQTSQLQSNEVFVTTRIEINLKIDKENKGMAWSLFAQPFKMGIELVQVFLLK